MGVAGGEPAAVVDAGVVAVAAAVRRRPGADRRRTRRRGSASLPARRCRRPRASLPQRGPKPRDDGAVDGPDQPAAPPWIGPAGSGAEPLAASWAAISPWIAATSPSSSSSWALICASAASRSAAGARRAPAWRLSSGAGVGQLLLFGGDRVAGGFDPVLGARAAGRRRSWTWSRRSRTRPTIARPSREPVEVLGAGGEVVDAAGAEDHPEHVGAAGLVDRDQPLAQGDECALEARPQFTSRSLARRAPPPPGSAPPAWRRAARGPRPRGCAARRPRRSGGRFRSP